MRALRGHCCPVRCCLRNRIDAKAISNTYMSVAAQVLLNRLLAKARFRHLQVLVRLAEVGSIRRTAESIGLTQPAVTQLLADLESLLDVPLFHRHARGVWPTAACQDLLPLARQSLSGLSATAEVVAERAVVGKGVVRVVASTAGVNGLLTRCLPGFNSRYPELQLHVQEADGQELFLGISRQQVDLALCREPQVLPEGWAFMPLLEDEFQVFCSPRHLLAGTGQVSWQVLAGQTWLISPVASAARHQLDRLCADFMGPVRQCQVITRTSAMTWALLQREDMVTLAPASVFAQLRAAGQLVALPLPSRLPFRPLGLLQPQRDVPVATACLVAYLAQWAQDPGCQGWD